MTVDIKVARRLSNNYVQVDVTPKNMETRHYKMPAGEADSFTASYKKYDSKTRTDSTILMTAMVIAGGFTGTIIPKLLKAPSIISIVCGIAGAIAGDVGSTFIMANKMQKNEAAILKKHNAHELILKENTNFLDSRRA